MQADLKSRRHEFFRIYLKFDANQFGKVIQWFYIVQ